MEMEHRAGYVRFWWGRRYAVQDPEATGARVENRPDVVMTEAQANAFVVEMLRGPMGPQGPMGAAG